MNESSISSILKRIDTKMPKSTQECPQKNPTNRFPNDDGYHGNRYWMKRMQMNFLLKISLKLF